MIRKSWKRIVLRGVVAVGCVGCAAGQAQTVRMQPPPPVFEHPDRAPGRGYAWVPGYQRWDGRAFRWEGGRWVVPPRPGARWVPGRWMPERGGWHWVPGHWRA